MVAEAIVVVGGGFAGFWAALAARRVGGGRLPVTLVSRAPRLEIRPRLYEAKPETLAVDLLPLLEKTGIDFVAGEAIGVDAAGQRLLLAGAAPLSWSRLVVTTGSRMVRPPIPGAADVHAIDTQAEAVQMDAHLKRLASAGGIPRIAVVGAGFTGIELVLELRDRLRAHGAERIAEAAEIHLFERSAHVGPELGPGPRPQILAALEDARVRLHLGEAVASLGMTGVATAGGSVELDMVVLTTGMAAAEFTRAIPGARDPLGRILVDRTLGAPAAPGVFVAGDSAAADTGDGHLALQSCQHAMPMGRFAGENAARELLGMPLVPYSQPRYVTCLDLGRHGAVLTSGWDRQVRETGAQAKQTKRWINRVAIYPPADAPAEELLARSSVEGATQRRADTAQPAPA